MGELARPHWKQAMPAAARSQLSATASVGGPPRPRPKPSVGGSHVRARQLQSADPASAPGTLDAIVCTNNREKPPPNFSKLPGGSEATPSGCAGAPPPEASYAGCGLQSAVMDIFYINTRQKNLRPTLPSCPEAWRLLTE